MDEIRRKTGQGNDEISDVYHRNSQNNFNHIRHKRTQKIKKDSNREMHEGMLR